MSLPPRETAVQLPENHGGGDTTLVDKFPVDLDDEPCQFDLPLGHAKKRSVSLWASDAILLLLEHVQVFGLVLSMSLSWPWPLDWIEGASFVFVFNLDLWELVKVSSVYEGQTHAFEKPSTVPFHYLGYAICWLVAAVFLPVLCYLYYTVVSRQTRFRGPVHALLLRARVVRWFCLIVQALSLPFGLTVVRLFGCQDYPLAEGGEQLQSTVLRDTECGSVEHLGILVPAVLVSAFYFVSLPLWMVYRTRKELIMPSFCTCRNGTAHEQFVLIKEAEYALGLDISWAIRHYPLFSSFKRPWVCFRPHTFFAKGIILVIYGLFAYDVDNPTFAVCAFVSLCWFIVLLIPVYRLWSFQAMLVFSVFINMCNLLIGVLVVLEVQNALFVGENLLNSLLVLNTFWVFGAVVWIAYLAVRTCSSRKKSLWPVLPQLDRSSSLHSEHTEKFCGAILHARKVLEQCYSATQFFAPVHELSRHIQIINAYCREAEFLQDPMHPSLWALLAEMVDLHTELASHSIYGTSTKESLPQTVEEFLALVPAFRQRLEQRDHYLILSTPFKRRVLLKAFVASTFFVPKAGIRTESRASSLQRGSRVSTLSILQDDTEEYNDDFLMGVEKWVDARQGTSQHPLAKSLRKMPRNTSTDSTQSNERFIVDVERWEIARRLSVEQRMASRPKRLARKPTTSSTGSLQSNDLYIQNVDRWVSDRRSSLASCASRSSTKQRQPRASAEGSSTASVGRMSVRFNLDTISETEGSTLTLPSTSSSNPDVFT